MNVKAIRDYVEAFHELGLAALSYGLAWLILNDTHVDELETPYVADDELAATLAERFKTAIDLTPDSAAVLLREAATMLLEVADQLETPAVPAMRVLPPNG